MSGLTSIAFAPYLPWAVAGRARRAAAPLLIVFGLVRRARGLAWRTLAIVGAARRRSPTRCWSRRSASRSPTSRPIVVDDSPSQSVGTRAARGRRGARRRCSAALAAMPGLDVRVVHAGAPKTGAGGQPTDGTQLFDALSHALADVPRKRMAATFLVTDGEVHDVPDREQAAALRRAAARAADRQAGRARPAHRGRPTRRASAWSARRSRCASRSTTRAPRARPCG